MNWRIGIILGLCCAMSVVHAAADVRYDRSKGIYYQSDTGYEADPLTQLCFKGTSEISCAKLAKRPEWSKHIAWEVAETDTNRTYAKRDLLR